MRCSCSIRTHEITPTYLPTYTQHPTWGDEAGQGARAAMKKLDVGLVQQDALPASLLRNTTSKPPAMPTTLRPRCVTSIYRGSL